jgi:ribosomal-protein-alanine N-acetyltransferase
MDILLYSERLFLNLVKLDDLDEIHELHSLPETDRFNTLGIPLDIEQTKEILLEWIARAGISPDPEYVFSLRDQRTNLFIGLIALKLGNPKFRIAEVWYKLHVKHWQKGYGTEALNRILDFGFNDLKLHRIEAGTAIDNLASIRVLQKAGMQKEGRKRKALPLKSGWSDNFEFAMLEEDWQK